MTNSLSHSVKTRKKRPSPVSLRLSDEQRSELQSRAGNLALGAYIKSVLFDASASGRAAPKGVTANQADLAKILAWLGRTEIAAHLAIMAEATKSGSLVVNPVVAAQLNKACSDIADMRNALMQAMGKQTNGQLPAPSQLVQKRRISAAEFKALTQAQAQPAVPQPKKSESEALRALDDVIKAWKYQP